MVCIHILLLQLFNFLSLLRNQGRIAGGNKSISTADTFSRMGLDLATEVGSTGSDLRVS